MDNNRKNRRPIAAVIAVCAVAVLTVTAFASGGGVLERVFRMMTGSTVTQGIDGDGVYYAENSVEEPVSPVELRAGGRLYLTVNGEDRDITDLCSYETPSVYECTGWVEYASADIDGTALSSTALSIPEDADLHTLPWLQKGLEQVTGGRTVIWEVAETEPSMEANGPGVYTSGSEVTLTENPG